MKHQGSCHCGGIRFEVEGDIGSVIDCNCSLCRRRGGLLWFVPASAFRLLTSDAEAATYRFNKMHIAHRFCARCGVAPFGQGSDPKGNAMVAINVRCLPEVDLASLEVVAYDGASL
jgi:hypothetical protein